MSPDIAVFVSLAELAGVFVGFAALISFSRGSDIGAGQLVLIRGVVTIGLLVIIAALVPVGLDRYGVEGRALWLTSSVLFLVLLWSSIIFGLRRPENRVLMAAQMRDKPVWFGFFWVLLEVPIHVPLLLTVVGVFPDLQPAFYATALGFQLFEAAFVLAQLVYSRAASPIS